MAAKKPAPKAAARKPAPTKSPPAKKAVAKPPAATVAPVEMVLWHLPVDQLDPDPENPRADTDPARLQALAANIAHQGILQPLRVVAGEGDRWTIKIGHRRWRAAQLAGLSTVPCLPYVPHGDAAQLEAYIDQASENLQREDLTPLDLARFLQGLRDRYGVKVTQIPEVLKVRGIEMSRSHVSNMIRLTELPAWAQAWVRDGTLPQRTARAMTNLIGTPEAFSLAVHRAIDQYMRVDGTAPCSEDLPGIYIDAMTDAGYLRPRRTYTDRDTEGCHYDFERADRAALGVVELPYIGPVITNVEHHQALNEQARAQRRERDATAAAQTRTQDGAEGKAPAATKPLNPERLRGYVHAWIARHIIETYFPGGIEDRRDPSLVTSIAVWSAYSCPMLIGSHHTPDDGAVDASRAACEGAGITEVAHALARTAGQDYATPVARAVLHGMKLHNLRAVADHLGMDLASVYRVDAAFTELHQKAQLAAMVTAAGLATEEPWARGQWQSQKTATLREWCVEHRFELGLPASIRELWESVVTTDADRALQRLPTCVGCECAEDELDAGWDLLAARFPDDQENEKTVLDLAEAERASLWHVVDRHQRVGICASCWDVQIAGDAARQLERARLLQAYQDRGGTVPAPSGLEHGDRTPGAEYSDDDTVVTGSDVGDVVQEMSACGVREDWQP